MFFIERTTQLPHQSHPGVWSMTRHTNRRTRGVGRVLPSQDVNRQSTWRGCQTSASWLLNHVIFLFFFPATFVQINEKIRRKAQYLSRPVMRFVWKHLIKANRWSHVWTITVWAEPFFFFFIHPPHIEKQTRSVTSINKNPKIPTTFFPFWQSAVFFFPVN